MININMRCIEIPMHLRHDGRTYSININMRCIEIGLKNFVTGGANLININMRCIEIKALMSGTACTATD